MVHKSLIRHKGPCTKKSSPLEQGDHNVELPVMLANCSLLFWLLTFTESCFYIFLHAKGHGGSADAPITTAARHCTCVDMHGSVYQLIPLRDRMQSRCCLPGTPAAAAERGIRGIVLA